MIKFENTEVFGWGAAIRGMRNPMNSWHLGDTDWFDVTDDRAVESDHWLDSVNDEALVLGENDLDLMKRLRNAGTDHRKYLRMIAVYVDITAPLYWWKEADTYKVGTVANSCSTMHKIVEKEFTLSDFSCEHLMTINDVGIHYAEEFPYFEEKDGEMLFWTPIGILNHTIEALNFYRRKYIETKSKPMKDEKARKALMKKYWWQMIQLLPSSYNQKRTVMMNYEVLNNMYKSRCLHPHRLDEWSIGFKEWVDSLPYAKELIIGED